MTNTLIILPDTTRFSVLLFKFVSVILFHCSSFSKQKISTKEKNAKQTMKPNIKPPKNNGTFYCKKKCFGFALPSPQYNACCLVMSYSTKCLKLEKDGQKANSKISAALVAGDIPPNASITCTDELRSI